jgi:hypothetical protein
VAAAVQSQRELAALLGTQFETQRILIFDEKNPGPLGRTLHPALCLLVDILSGNWTEIPT